MTSEEINQEISRLAEELVRECTEKQLKISTAESCTGGLISGAVTAVPGSSAVIELGICSYSNRIKREVLGVSEEILNKYTEYSVQCAEAMADGVRRLSGADLAVSVTGVAGPGGDSPQHPLGEVCIAVSTEKGCHAERFLFGRHDREVIRMMTVKKALELLIERI